MGGLDRLQIGADRSMDRLGGQQYGGIHDLTVSNTLSNDEFTDASLWMNTDLWTISVNEGRRPNHHDRLGA